MDHRNGGDPLAPPRPPKLLPTVHRTRAAAIDTDRIIMNASPQVKNINNNTSSISSSISNSSTNSNSSTISTLPLSASTNLLKSTTPTTICSNSSSNNVNSNSHGTCSIIASKTPTPTTTTTPPPPPPPHKSSLIATPPPPPPPHKPSTIIATSSNQHANKQQPPPPTLPKSTTSTSTPKTTAHNQLQRHINNNEVVNNNNISVIYPRVASDYDHFQILHLTYLPELPHQQQLNNNNNNNRHQTKVGNATITATNSFSRRRALPPLPQSPATSTSISGNNNSTLFFGGSGVGALSPISTTTATTINGGINNNNNNNNNNGVANFLSHFHSFEPHSAQNVSSTSNLPTSITIAAATPLSPAVTLTHPRPESERLNNEYVETPLRQQQLLQQQQQQQFTNSTSHVLQLQHAGGGGDAIDNHHFNDDGQSSTHHLLMLPQRRNVIQQQQQILSNIGDDISTSTLQSSLIISPNLTTPISGRTITTPLSSPSLRTDTNIGLLHSHNTFKSDTNTTTAKKLGKTMSGEQKGSISTITTTTTPTTKNAITKQPRSINHMTVDAIDAASGSRNNDSGVAIVMVGVNNNNNNNNNNNTNSGCNNFLTRNNSNRGSNTTINNVKNNGKDRQALEDLLTPHSNSNNNNNNNNNTNSHNNHQHYHQHNGHERLGNILANDTLNSLTCPSCNKCRCEQCMSPRPLPQSWICKQKCFCSADTTLDTCTCLCCAKAIFYHCAADSDGMDYDDSGAPCVDDPCSCSPYKRTQRWGWLCALSLVMPCLWCYWPLRGCTKLCEMLYGHFGKRGCRCRQSTLPSSASAMLPNLRLGLITTNVATLNNNNGSATGGNVNDGGVVAINVLHDNSSSIVNCGANEMVSIGSGGKFPCVNNNRNISSSSSSSTTSSSSSCKNARNCHAESTSEKHLLDTSLDY